MSKPFSEKLKEYRKELEEKRNQKVGQVQLAKELGISNGNIGNLESGNRLPSKKLLIKLTEHSGKTLEYWLDGIENYKAPNSVDFVLDKMIKEGVIKDANIDDYDIDVMDVIKEAVRLEIERKLK